MGCVKMYFILKNSSVTSATSYKQRGSWTLRKKGSICNSPLFKEDPERGGS